MDEDSLKTTTNKYSGNNNSRISSKVYWKDVAHQPIHFSPPWRGQGYFVLLLEIMWCSNSIDLVVDHLGIHKSVLIVISPYSIPYSPFPLQFAHKLRAINEYKT